LPIVAFSVAKVGARERYPASQWPWVGGYLLSKTCGVYDVDDPLPHTISVPARPRCTRRSLNRSHVH